MARLFPDLLPLTESRRGLRTELDVLRKLESELPDTYALFHSVGWTRADSRREQHGEADIVVVNQAGDLLVMEVKGGQVEFERGDVIKTYGEERKSVLSQVGRTYQGMRGRLSDAGLGVEVYTLLVLPHVQAKGATMDSPRTRIVDAPEMPLLALRIEEILGEGAEDLDRRQGVMDFLSQVLEVEPDVSALTGHLAEHTTRISSGLATWVPRIHSPERVIRVVATAGSGKTQLALHMLRAADAAGLRAAYFCFNRALADHLKRIAPASVRVATFHQMAVQVCKDAGEPPDFADPEVWRKVVARARELLVNSEADLDVLVIDEMQDLQAEWVETLLGTLLPTGLAVLLEDPEQNLYKDREPFDIPGEVVVMSPDNHRSPRIIVDLINQLGLTAQPVQSAGAWAGEWSAPLVYDGSEADMLEQTVQAVRNCIEKGFALHQITLLTMRGLGSSALLRQETLGPWRLKRFSGTYDAQSDPIWTEGELLADSVFRFKGQAAPAVVLSEIDFAEFDENAKRRLFVGLTRARVHWEWVVSVHALELLAARF